MIDPFAVAMLALESQNVIERRLVRLAWGGSAGCDEAGTIVSEKIAASIEAAGTLAMGGSLDAVVARYREHVAANARRLGAE